MSAQAFRSEVRASDADAVERLVHATGVFSRDETAIARELVEASLTDGAHASGYHFLFADGGDGLRGYTCFGPISGTVGRYELYWIAVHPDERRSGLGKLLMQASEDAVRALGGAYVFAETSTRADYAAARKFYEAAGYRAMGEVADWYADGDGLAIYGKRLTSAAR
jgi:ribosomal protein S18 acetylase RimI-like enzyme